MIQSNLHRIWHFAGHRPAIGASMLTATFAIQSLVAYGHRMLY